MSGHDNDEQQDHVESFQRHPGEYDQWQVVDEYSGDLAGPCRFAAFYTTQKHHDQQEESQGQVDEEAIGIGGSKVPETQRIQGSVKYYFQYTIPDCMRCGVYWDTITVDGCTNYFMFSWSYLSSHLDLINETNASGHKENVQSIRIHGILPQLVRLSSQKTSPPRVSSLKVENSILRHRN